jgi:radical SAM superfamily enzyme YgiQ (UPF0313 family)
VWRDGDEIRVQAPPPRLQDLEQVRPAWHLLELSRYAGINIMTSRGCPYPCAFCSVAPIWGREPVVRDARAVVAEMAELKDRVGRNVVLFQDEHFVSSPERVHSAL